MNRPFVRILARFSDSLEYISRKLDGRLLGHKQLDGLKPCLQAKLWRGMGNLSWLTCGGESKIDYRSTLASVFAFEIRPGMQIGPENAHTISLLNQIAHPRTSSLNRRYAWQVGSLYLSVFVKIGVFSLRPTTRI